MTWYTCDTGVLYYIQLCDAGEQHKETAVGKLLGMKP
jgi:hypothetical protein